MRTLFYRLFEGICIGFSSWNASKEMKFLPAARGLALMTPARTLVRKPDPQVPGEVMLHVFSV